MRPACPAEPSPSRPRRRLIYCAATLLVIGLGLASRKFPGMFPPVLGKYPGDVLWALMAFTALGALRPGLSTARLAALALLISYADEISQLYQAPWINQIRAHPLGHLVLGTAFSWDDMLSYTVGVAIGLAAELLLRRGPGRGRRQML